MFPKSFRSHRDDCQNGRGPLGSSHVLTSQAKLTQSIPSHRLYLGFGLPSSQVHRERKGGTGGPGWSLQSGLGKTDLDKTFWKGQKFKPSSLIRADLGLHWRDLNLSLDGGINESWGPNILGYDKNLSFRSGRFVLGIEKAHPIFWECVSWNETRAWGFRKWWGEVVRLVLFLMELELKLSTWGLFKGQEGRLATVNEY